MNRAEFDSWLSGHQAAFGVVGNNFGKLAPDQRKITEDLWFEALEGVAHVDAIEATREMLLDKKLQPYRVEHHPSTLVKIAGRAKTLRMSKEERAKWGDRAGEVVKCLRCADGGWLYVWETRYPEGSSLVQYVDRSGKKHPIPRISDTPCPFCELGLEKFRKFAPRHLRHKERDVGKIEAILVPGVNRNDQIKHVQDLEKSYVWAMRKDMEEWAKENTEADERRFADLRSRAEERAAKDGPPKEGFQKANPAAAVPGLTMPDRDEAATATAEMTEEEKFAEWQRKRKAKGDAK